MTNKTDVYDLSPYWMKCLDEYFSFGREPRPIGRPRKKISEDLILFYKLEGKSNRAIARELDIPRRTIDRRVSKLREEGRL